MAGFYCLLLAERKETTFWGSPCCTYVTYERMLPLRCPNTSRQKEEETQLAKPNATKILARSTVFLDLAGVRHRLTLQRGSSSLACS